MASDELEARLRLADGVLRSLDGVPPSALRLLARGLALAGGSVRDLGEAFDCFADAVEFPDATGDLARLRLARALRTTARGSGCAELLARLDGVSEPPWPAIRDALEAAAIRSERRAP